MNRLDLEAEALKLPVVEHAQLAEALLQSLDVLSDEEHRRVWTDEAARRDAELDVAKERAKLTTSEVGWSPCEESNLVHQVRSPVPCSAGQGEKSAAHPTRE